MHAKLHTGCLAAMLFASLAAGGAHAAAAQNSCVAHYQNARGSLESFNHELASTANEVRRLENAGLDPNRYIVDYDRFHVLLTVKFHALAEKIVSQTMAADDDASACKQDVLPYLKMADVEMIYQHYGLDKLLPPEITRTDYVQVVRSGALPAGEAAPMPQGPGEPMQAMAIGGETAMMIEKPYCVFGICSAHAPF
jgi:hypothetical protein